MHTIFFHDLRINFLLHEKFIGMQKNKIFFLCWETYSWVKLVLDF